MNSIISIFIIFSCTFLKTTGAAEEKVCGVWKGFYGTENFVNEIIIRINPQNKAEIFCGHTNGSLTATGSYKLSGDSAIIISTILPGSKTPEIILYGNLNLNASFIDGEWDDSVKEKGCFYLQKQPAITAY